MSLPNKYEPKIQENIWRDFWDKEKIYRFDEKSTKPIFSVDTPPPYVSADHLHPGHIMSYSQAEFVVRFKRMQGFNVFYPMGFDDNGLPTERHIEKKYKINKNSISRPDFVKLCLEETQQGAKNYKELWELMGISVDWTKTYSTINPHSQKIAQWSFLDLYKKRYLERREDPIMWDISFQSALAQTDLEDDEQKSFLNDIEFLSENREKLIISTTRPELIPACVALFCNPNDERYKHLVGKKAITPILNQEVPIMTDEAVDIEFGTGLMMVCTWGDAEDILKWKTHKLETKAILKENGVVNELGGIYEGIHISKLRKIILEDLTKENKLISQKEITHTVQVSERSGVNVEFIKTKQWFINITQYKTELLEQAQKLNWHPKRMFSIYQDWVTSLKWDWCISRQRYYGVPLPVWYHKETGEIILPQEDELPVDPTAYTPKGYNPEDLIAEEDVMDTWMTSSLSPMISSKLVQDLDIQARLYPSSLRPQAFEIIRTWLFYTVAKSFFHHKSLPFRDVMISGHGLDKAGKKISKRLGNYTPPQKTVDLYGADAFRFWATGTTLGENIRFNEDEIKKGKKTVNKLFNASKFLEMHLGDFDPKSKVSLENSDKWILDELNQTVKKATESFESYEYFRARSTVDTFFWSVFTDNYLEFIKYRLYGEDKDSKESALYTLYTVLLAIIKLYAPILPFITEEIYQGVFLKFENTKSIHLASWPVVDSNLDLSEEKRLEFAEVLKFVEQIRAFKSQNSISLGKNIESFEIESNINLSDYKEFFEKALRVDEVRIG